MRLLARVHVAEVTAIHEAQFRLASLESDGDDRVRADRLIRACNLILEEPEVHPSILAVVALMHPLQLATEQLRSETHISLSEPCLGRPTPEGVIEHEECDLVLCGVVQIVVGILISAVDFGLGVRLDVVGIVRRIQRVEPKGSLVLRELESTEVVIDNRLPKCRRWLVFKIAILGSSYT